MRAHTSPVVALTLLGLLACSGNGARTASESSAGDTTRAASMSAADSIAVPQMSRAVRINGVALSSTELSDAEQVYHLRIPDADYWYDPVLGSWGITGSPILGFIAPGLKLGGLLAADASGTGTRVFVNGRELHTLDAAALQRIVGTITPGRYVISADGLGGVEGATPRWNLAALSSRQNGGAASWQSRLVSASAGVDGAAGAFALPDGGIVTTGG